MLLKKKKKKVIGLTDQAHWTLQLSQDKASQEMGVQTCYSGINPPIPV